MIRAGALALAVLLVACGKDNMPVCAPGATATCYCNTGAPGAQVCGEDGLSYGGCVCLPDAGAGSDAAAQSDAGPTG